MTIIELEKLVADVEISLGENKYKSEVLEKEMNDISDGVNTLFSNLELKYAEYFSSKIRDAQENKERLQQELDNQERLISKRIALNLELLKLTEENQQAYFKDLPMPHDMEFLLQKAKERDDFSRYTEEVLINTMSNKKHFDRVLSNLLRGQKALSNLREMTTTLTTVNQKIAFWRKYSIFIEALSLFGGLVIAYIIDKLVRGELSLAKLIRFQLNYWDLLLSVAIALFCVLFVDGYFKKKENKIIIDNLRKQYYLLKGNSKNLLTFEKDFPKE